MKFGSVDNPETIDFSLPADHPDTEAVLNQSKSDQKPQIFVGCAKWNRQDLKNFYPRGTKDELEYYSSQFNCIELNASFYRIFPPEQFAKWRDKTPNDFKFSPKVPQLISHLKRLNDVSEVVDAFAVAASELGDKLGPIFLQMHNNFAPKDWARVEAFMDYWPSDLPLAVEFRHTNWYNDSDVANRLYDLLEKYGIGNVITDTAGRRDLLHMRLTNSVAFVRYVGANHESDYQRLDGWIDRIEAWVKLGLKELYFYVHQNIEKESPLLSAYFIEKLNSRIGCELKIPETLLGKGLF